MTNEFQLICALIVALGLFAVAIRAMTWWATKRRVRAAHETLKRYHIAVVAGVENSCCVDDLVVIFTADLYPEIVFCSRCGWALPDYPCKGTFWEGVAIQFERLRDTHGVDTLTQAKTEIKDALRVLDWERDLWMPKSARHPPPS